MLYSVSCAGNCATLYKLQAASIARLAAEYITTDLEYLMSHSLLEARESYLPHLPSKKKKKKTRPIQRTTVYKELERSASDVCMKTYIKPILQFTM